jgi:hypothetical protein
MSARDLEAEFAARGIFQNGALLLDEKAALALIDRAALLGVAIKGIDQVRTGDVPDYASLKGSGGDDGDRSASWDHARGFIRALAGRGLLFEIVLEDRSPTRVVRSRGYMTQADSRSFLFSAFFIVGLAIMVVLMSARVMP